MTHDFARQRAARATRAGKPATPGWLWFVTGVICGTLGSFLVYLATLAPQHRGAHTAAAVAAAATQKEAAAAGPVEKPQFDFYTILPESEVIVGERPADPASAPKAADKREPAATTPAVAPGAAKPKPVEVPEPPRSLLLLQAGSFRQFAEADRRRANIILLGYPARVETVSMRSGETWYRVQVGPFQGPGALAEARGALRDQGIESVEIGKRA